VVNISRITTDTDEEWRKELLRWIAYSFISWLSISYRHFAPRNETKTKRERKEKNY